MTTNTFRRLMMRGGLALCALAAAGAAQAQAKVIKLGWPTPDTATDPYAVGAHAFKKHVEQLSKGSIEVQLYPNRQLGDERPMLEGLMFGTVDAALTVNAVVAQIEPAFQLNDLPFLYSTEQQAHKVLDGPVGQTLTAKLEPKGIVVLGYMEGGFRNMINNKRAVSTPADVVGVKYRVMQNPVYIEMFNSMGGAATPMAWGETFTAVQQGTIDGLEAPLAVIDSSKFHEVTKFLSLTNHTYSVTVFSMSKRTMAKLSPDQQKAVRDAAALAVAEQRKLSAEASRQMVATLQSKGMKVNAIADVAAFRKSVVPVYERFRTSIGPALLDQALAQVK